jgi:predicted transglutaminase-like cysteine proteinase
MRNISKSIITIIVLLLYFTSTFSSSAVAKDLITQKITKAAGKKYGKYATNRYVTVDKKLLKKLKGQSNIKKLHAVNTFVNMIKYQSDSKVYGVNDYWATLYEFLGKGKGDCEDYTITKYYILKELGVDPKKMKFAYVVYKDKRGAKISHMVLAYLTKKKVKTRKDILILDNTNGRVLPASERKNITKVVRMINGDTGPKSKKWKKLEKAMKRKKM